ncbi:MAG: type VII secretion protein EssC [Desulfitobacteriaceae bacterium]|nr:type VII secretion protein EssC [Desulfitobacteriaceae bacterium]MDD4401885.1 type VII secretion protein EssC [Desulfitobacteriaceae bacterium]
MNIEFSRQPRFLPEIPTGEIEVPNPPNEYQKPEISWFALLAPSIVMLIVTLLVAMSFQSVFLLISIATTVTTVIVSLTGAATQIRKYKKQKKEREQKYLQFIADTKSELMIAKEQQTNAMKEMNPEATECVQRIMKIDNRLWERTPSYNDFLSLRIGVGRAPLAMRIKYIKQAIIMESDPLLTEPQRLALEFEKIPDVPISVNLVKSQICGIAGEAEQVAELVKLLLLQLITHHGYDDVRIVLLVSEKGLAKWKWARFLPHLWDDGFITRTLICGQAMAHQTLAEIYPILKEREMKTISGGALPHFVFIVEDNSLLENEPINKYLYNECAKLSVSTVFMAQNAAYLPMNCRTVITLHGKSAELADRVSGEKVVFIPDKADFKNLELAARKMAALRIKNAGVSFALPQSITLLEMMKVPKVSEIDVLSRWEKNRTYKGMSVPIGVKAGGAPFYLDIHETGFGPHGLVAGTTGSGKSELLQSIIISLAMNFHPHDVVFVLIDYKGGGMADVFKNMPHLVGTITNLGGNQTTRALLSIKSELMRRQRIFSDYGVNNIDKYQKLYHSPRDNGEMPAIPHLIMIADEFAELKQDQPDFMKELVSTARVGRSLGVHLILATQKPAGVVDDQIWSNSRFKICLKVQDEADSKDVIKRPDAALIKEPGRAYIQVGNDEVFELFQSAYSGADYDPEGERQKSANRTKRIYTVSLNGKTQQIYPLDEEKIAIKELPSQLKAMVQHIINTSGSIHLEPLEGPWRPPLPETIYLDEFFSTPGMTTKGNELLNVPIGITDDPRGQKQETFKIDFATDGNLFIYGAPGAGKTCLLKTLCLSLAHCYTPEEVNLYIMDFGGTGLKAFQALPHCGGVMTLEEESRINHFILFLFRVIEERKKLFEETGSEGFNDFRANGRKLPALITLIDNYFALSETYEVFDDKIMVLAREGIKYGIYFVATATNAAMVRYKLAVNFKMALCLQLIDQTEYPGIVGRTEGLEPAKVAGRGLVRGKPPLEFQTAQPEFKNMDTDQIIQAFQRRDTGRAVPIPVMPTKVNIRAIKKKEGYLSIGLGDNDLSPVYVDLYTTPVMMVAGDPMAGKSTLLVSWIKMTDNVEVYAYDSKGMGLYKIMEMPNVTDLAKVGDDFANELLNVLEDRRKQLLDYRRAAGNINELLKSWKQLIFVIDRLSELTRSDNDSLKDLLEKIVREAHGLKVAVIAADNISEFMNNWDSLSKAIKEEQTGVLLGSIKEQGLYTVRVPFSTPEKDLALGDGYYIIKNKYTGLRFAIIED